MVERTRRNMSNKGKPQDPGEPHHIADEPLPEPGGDSGAEQPPTTDTGLNVEDQVRKEWEPGKDGGLPTFLGNRAR